MACSAASATRSTLMRSTPGMDATGTRLPRPSATKIGQIRSAGVSTFSATSRRDQPTCGCGACARRERRRRAIGGASSAGRSSAAAALGDGLGERLHGTPGPRGCWARTAHCGQARGQGKGRDVGASLLADLGVLDPLGHVEVEVVLVGVVGLGAQHGVEELAGGAVGSAQEFCLAQTTRRCGASGGLGPPRRLGGARPRLGERSCGRPGISTVTPGMLIAMPGRKISGTAARRPGRRPADWPRRRWLAPRCLRLGRLALSRPPPWRPPPGPRSGGRSGPNRQPPGPPGRAR